jgi:hypothetical protein
MKLRTETEADINITSMIDCLMMIIIFFMTIMSAQYIYGVAIKFPSGRQPQDQVRKPPNEKEKYITVYVQADLIDTGHTLLYPGILKVNGEEFPMVSTPAPTTTDVQSWMNVYKVWQAEQDKGYDRVKAKIQDLLKQGYKKDMLMIQGEMKTYHIKTMRVIDLGKSLEMDGFSLVPPLK